MEHTYHGKGDKGTVYRYDDETIVKVYNKYGLEEINHERYLAKFAFVSGIPSAIAYDTVKVGDKYGSVFELINASSLQELIIKGEDIDSLTKETIGVLKLIHSTKVEEGQLPSKRLDILERAKYCSKSLPKEISEKLITAAINLFTIFISNPLYIL